MLILQDVDVSTINNDTNHVYIFGRTSEGKTACIVIVDFCPYLYISMPSDVWDANKTVQTSCVLTEFVQTRARNAATASVLVTQTQKYDLCNAECGLGDYLCLTVPTPDLVTFLRRSFERNEAPPLGDGRKIQTYESNVPHILRFMIDARMRGMSWLTVKNEQQVKRKKTTCEIEITVSFSDIEVHDALSATDWRSSISPLKVLSFDIECSAPRGSFPNAERDSIIQIANILRRHGAPAAEMLCTVFVVGECLRNVDGIDSVYCFETEFAMLDAWGRFVTSEDPDVLLGYNVVNFDIPYIVERCKQLGVRTFCSRFSGRQVTSRARVQQSNQHGARETHVIDMPGRIVFDMLQIIRNDTSIRLRSYKLNSVASELIGEQKEDLPYQLIEGLHRGGPEDRARIAKYCAQDARLPLRLMDKQKTLYNMVEMARVTGLPIGWLLTRGQAIRVIAQIWRTSKTLQFIVPALTPKAQIENENDNNDNNNYEGATVLEPIKGLYREPIATLDFASLYPSIMMAHNMCYSTLVSPEAARRIRSDCGESKLNAGDVTESPSTGCMFYKRHVREGVLPIILQELVAARARARAELKNVSDEQACAVLNGRQLALKVCANSVYGFTGATCAMLPCVEIAASVTSFGRQMIDMTKAHVEEHYPGALVVYGDTDSVMVKFAGVSVADAMRLGDEAARLVSATFTRPIKLEFEKVYQPFLLLAKKRYAGMKHVSVDTPPKMDVKGIETVRRDNCKLVGKTMETCLDLILAKDDAEGAKSYVRDTLSSLLKNQVDIQLLVISRGLSKLDYANRQPHAELAKKIAARGSAEAPVTGDRVPFVIVSRGKGAKIFECSEDPKYVIDNGLPIDTEYYINHQLRDPLERIFSAIMQRPNDLFTGDHMRVIVKPKLSGKHGMLRFIRVQSKKEES